MASQQRGLPSGFGLKVAPTATRPVVIGDYLDEDVTPPPPVVVAKKAPVPLRPVVEQPVMRETEAAPPPPKPVIVEPAEPSAVSRKGPPRKQINMKPETLRKAEELVAHVQRFSVQKDAKASEVFDALVELLHDAKKHLDVSSVPPRGQWGTPTARGFRTSLKNAFAEAIVLLQQAKEQP